jgi:hypothetical protein
MFAYTGRVRPQAVGTGERFAPVHPPDLGAEFPGSQARQLHLTFLRLPGIISELLDAGLAALVFSLSFSQRTARSVQNPSKTVNRFLT